MGRTASERLLPIRRVGPNGGPLFYFDACHDDIEGFSTGAQRLQIAGFAPYRDL
jgi:hypothetical protein